MSRANGTEATSQIPHVSPSFKHEMSNFQVCWTQSKIVPLVGELPISASPHGKLLVKIDYIVIFHYRFAGTR